MFVFSLVFLVGFGVGAVACCFVWVAALFLISEVDLLQTIDHCGSSVGESHHA